MIEIVIVGVIIIFIVLYRSSDGKNVYKFIVDETGQTYNKVAPYSFKVMREKCLELGLEYSVKQYTIQVILFAGVAMLIGWFYHYSLIIAILYAIIAVCFIPYLTYLRCKRQYSEFIFEQIQVYATNTIMEFATTKAFVKALEGVVESGVLEDPVLSDVKTMIALSYEKGDIEASIKYMDNKYPFYMIKNMHQLFLQVTKEGAKNTEETFDNMLNDIDVLVDGVYQDRIARKKFHGQFLGFGFLLYAILVLVQFLLTQEKYAALLDNTLVRILVHFVVFINSFFLLKGEKYYNENVGVE